MIYLSSFSFQAKFVPSFPLLVYLLTLLLFTQILNIKIQKLWSCLTIDTTVKISPLVYLRFSHFLVYHTLAQEVVLAHHHARTP